MKMYEGTKFHSEVPSEFTVSYSGIRKVSSQTLTEDLTSNGVIREHRTPGDEKFVVCVAFKDNLNNGAFVRLSERLVRTK